ncbi:MAG TPA: gamma-glutamyltransferase, partial [Miltoncostaeaceae bacterium]|nr:gamma-glutamyltransferase [Miltoncostaeaceae bacterium]
MTGLGGDSFWLCWDARAARLSALQAAGAAAARATPELYRRHGLAAIPARGPLAALTVPGAPDGLFVAHRFSQEHLGSSIPWGDLLQAAIRHAADGIPVSPCQARVTASATDLLLAEECAFAPFRATYLVGGAAPAPGRRLAQPRLARTLERLAREGGRAFYEGELAAEIGRACEAVGSPLRAEDLAGHRSRWAEPATVPYRGGVAASVPPPSQGLVALAVLGILEGTDVRACAGEPADYIHLAVEATKLAFGDRDRWLADPERVAVPLGRLLDPAYLRDRGRLIAMDRAAPGPAASGVEGGDTIACVTADAAGNCVSLIQSLYHEWGSGVVAGETGVVLQNRGAGFTLDAAHPNALAPGKRPFHTLTPFMYLADGKPTLVAGTMGGEGQPQTLVALATRVVDFGLDVQAAVEAPRWVYGRTWGAPTRALSIEGRFGDAVAGDLTRRGHAVRVLEPWSDTAGHAQALRLEPGGLLVGGGDPRADGPALGC